MKVRRGSERGVTRLGWLDSRHTFSFGGYFDPDWMGFRTLRVLNDDTVAPGGGFGEHPHREMEIVSLVLDGELAHRDSMGNGSVIRPGEVQRMSAGTGIRHSEINPSGNRETRFLQIWIEPREAGIEPGYEQTTEPGPGADGWATLASPDGRGGSVRIHQNALLRRARLAPGGEAAHGLGPGHGAWVHLLAGRMTLAGSELGPGDAIGIEDEPAVRLVAGPEGADLLLFDLL